MLTALNDVLRSRAVGRLVREADAARDARDWATAAARYAKALAINPRMASIHVQHGHSLKEQGLLHQAEDAYRASLALAALNSDTHLQLGHLLKMMHRPDEALASYLLALELDPTSQDAAREATAMGHRPSTAANAEAQNGATREAPSFERNRVPILAAIDATQLQQPVVSFDLFDTLIWRQYLAVNEVHDTVSAYILAMLGRRAAQSPGQFTLTRYTVTNALKASTHAATEEPTLRQVFRHLIGAHLEPGRELDEIVDRAVRFELALDTENLLPVEGAVALLEHCRALGKTIVAVSDMYYEPDELRGLLRHLGLEHRFDAIFVSSEHGKTKQTGSLFHHVLETLSLTPADVIHIGDNRHGDIAVPQRLGIETIHVDQAASLTLRRPAYGQRTDVHVEVADLIKLFSFQILLDAVSRRDDHLYFLSRDGCLIHRVIDRWCSPLVTEFFPGIARSDLFLSRATSCWLNVNFQGEWLLQSIGHAFWLHHGKATARQISDILGIDEAPAALGDAVYRSDTETFTVLKAYRTAGLEAAIRASLEDKRASLDSYLADAGFFDHRSISVCDIGYSGTVVRDLNTFFLQESAKPDARRVPDIHFLAIAANGNYEHNSTASLPYVRFAPQPILPVARIPQSLIDSFSWLELFFKHPTYGPLLGYLERDGRVEPQYDLAEVDPGERHPSARVLAVSAATGSDIVLLWMAAIQFWSPFSDLFLKRFAEPDEATLGRMRDDIYETDAVTGRTRSIVIAAPEMADHEIYQAAKAQDCWIPGSILASALARRARDPVAGASPPTSHAAPVPRDGLDTPFYLAYYDDLRALPGDEALHKHFQRHGKAEGRFRSHAHMLEVLTAKHGDLPPDFDWREYLWANPDLWPHRRLPRAHAERHYLTQGRAEKRRLRAPLDELDRDFQALAAAGTLAFSSAEALAWKRGTMARAIVFARYDVAAGPWLGALDLSEFVALNFEWCGRVESKGEAVWRFLKEGVDRIAPLSLDTIFDPVFYRAEHPELRSASDAQAHWSWVRTGSTARLSPSERHRVLQLTGRSDFPATFDWERFRARHRGKIAADASRSDVLEHFLNISDASVEFVAEGEGAAALWEAVGLRAAQQGRRPVARLAFRNGLQCGGPAGRLWHKLGDLDFDDRAFDRAVAAYLKAIAAPAPDRWSFQKGVLAACEARAFSTALRFLESGRDIWMDAEPWRQARRTLFDRWFQHEQGLAGQGRAQDDAFAAFLDRFTETLRGFLPSTIDLRGSTGKVLLLTGAPISDRSKVAARARSVCLDGASGALQLFGRGDLRLFCEGLRGASLAIIHETDCDADVIHTIELARRYSIPTLFWAGELGNLAGCADLTNLDWPDRLNARDSQETGRTLTSIYAAKLCDETVTSSPQLLPALEALSRTGRVAYVPTAANQARQTVSRPGERVRIVVFGPPDEADAAADRVSLSEALARVLAAQPQVDLLVVPSLARSPALSRFANRVTEIDPRPTPAQSTSLVAASDILIDHTGTGPESRYRSPWADAASQGRPAILGPGRMDLRLTREVDCLVAERPKDLKQALLRLVGQPSLALAIGARARAAFALRWPAVSRPDDAGAPRDSRPSPRGRRRRILYGNVMFPPQTIGGATRVLKDNVDYILDRAADRFTVAGLASDNGNAERGATRCDTYRGAPVFRMATPQEINMDFRMHNSDVVDFTGDVLAIIKPDLVHIHCLQRLTVAFAETCRAAGYPYIITLHDGWWLSDFSFFVDEAGRPALPARDPLRQRWLQSLGPAVSLERAERLRAVLHGAERLLGVSEPFSAIFRDLGFAVQTLTNGVPRLAREPKRPAQSRVRLAHLGGLEHHKGAYLIEAVLRTHQFQNLSLTIVDLARDPGETQRTVWGNTPVEIIGRTPAHAIAGVYAGLDVLLAPSTWPESYGLVTREALACGLWVVASDQGAMGDDVVPGRNGFLIDVTTPEGLLGVLRAIDAEPIRYMASPASPSDMRTADDQSQELLDLYDQFASV